MASELVRSLVDSGIHFGHRVSRWNPKMAPYIFGRRNLIHIIDIRETVKGLLRAKKFVAQVASRGEQVLFVGTKRQARPAVEHHAKRVDMPYVSERWLGGMLTNFRTIRSRLGRLEELERVSEDGSDRGFGKKAIAARDRELRKIRRNLSGVRNMEKLPGVLVVVDVSREHTAVREAKKLGIPTICLIDTDSDPDFADIPIPGNDDAIRAIDTILEHLADTVEMGKRARPPEEGEDAGQRRRSRRATTARAEDTPEGEAEKLAAASADRVPTPEPEVAPVAETVPAPEPVAPAEPASIPAADVATKVGESPAEEPTSGTALSS